MENFVQSMTMQVEAQIHEESEFWSTSQPFYQAWQQVAKPIRDARKKTKGRNPTCSNFVCLCENFAQHAKSRGGAVAGLSEGQFRILCEILHTLRNHKMQKNKILHTMRNFAWSAKSSCAPTPLEFYLQFFYVNYYFLLVINQ